MITLNVIFILGLVTLYLWRENKDAKLVVALLKRLDELQSDNRALTEALSRKEGSPVIFKPRQPVPSEGWFDGKTHIIPNKEKP